MLKAGVIGVGNMGSNHARIYMDMDDVELVAVADASVEKGQRIARRYKVPAYLDYKEMLESEPLDLVSLAVPTRVHCQVALDVIGRGAHLLVEKPLARTEEEGRRIIEAARAEGVKLAVGHVERFNPAILQMKREIEQGALGEVFHVHARRLSPYPTRVRDVGVVTDLAPHDLDVMHFLVGADVTRIYAEREQRINQEREDGMSCLLRFANGVVGILEVNWLTPTKVRQITVSGARGMFVANYLTQELCFYENSKAPTDEYWAPLRLLTGVSEGRMVRLLVQRREPLWVELEDFVRAVREDRPPLMGGEAALYALNVTRALLRSGESGEVVHL